MADRPALIPGPDHPIAIEPAAGRVIVVAGSRAIADSRNALTLREADYPPVHYIPRADIDMAALARTEHGTHCPYKGDASYFSVPAGGAKAVDAAWSYEHPHEAVAAIAGHLAFYPGRVDEIREE